MMPRDHLQKLWRLKAHLEMQGEVLQHFDIVSIRACFVLVLGRTFFFVGPGQALKLHVCFWSVAGPILSYVGPRQELKLPSSCSFDSSIQKRRPEPYPVLRM